MNSFQFKPSDHWNIVSEEVYRALEAAGFGPDRLRIVPPAAEKELPVTREQALAAVQLIEDEAYNVNAPLLVLRRFIEEQP
jgi:hypothetical protein